MTDFTVCRVCLTDSVRVHSIANTELQELYENLTKTKVVAQDDWPVTLCYICYAQLQKCLNFVDLAKHSESLLLQLYHASIKLTQNTILLLDRLSPSYSTTPIKSLTLIDEQPTSESDFRLNENVCNVKNETEKLKQEPVDNGEIYIILSEVETDDVADSDATVCDDNIASSDSEDNITLTTFQEPRPIVKPVKVKHFKVKQKDKQKWGDPKDVEAYAQEVHLTPEQQTAEVVARSQSLNYLVSPFKCQLCFKGFLNEVTYSNHTQRHDESSGAHKCEVCSLRYESNRLLHMHRMRVHQRQFHCKKCGHVMHTRHQARDHEKNHQGLSFKCQLCSEKYSKRTTYLSHLRKKHPAFVCDVCGFSFVSHLGLQMHKTKMHKLDVQEETPDVPESERFCATCNIQFVCLDAYHRHLLISDRHSEAGGYRTTCIICQQDHGGQESLRIHMKVHTRKLLPTATAPRDDPSNSTLAELSCDMCSAVFMTKTRLAMHVNRKHYGVKPSKSVCEVCGRQFATKPLLLYHLRRHHGECHFPCARCDKGFVDASRLRAHARTHTGERPFACRTCSKTFALNGALKRHEMVHTGDKPYVCHLCSKSFSQSNHRNRHVRYVHNEMAEKYRKRKRSATTGDDEERQIEIKDI